MKESERLEKLFAEYYELQALFHNNAEVYAWFQQVFHDRCTIEEAMIGIIVNLAKQNKKYFDEIIELRRKKGITPADRIINPRRD